MTLTPQDSRGLSSHRGQAPLGCRYLDRADGRMVERASGQEVSLADVRSMLRAGDRLRVVSWPSGDDCTVEVLLELIAPVLGLAGLGGLGDLAESLLGQSGT